MRVIPTRHPASHHPRASRAAHRRAGLSILLLVLVLGVLIAFVSLAVDIGRLKLARAEMQTVADAAARSGALSLKDSSQDVIDEASAAALLNPVIDTEKFDPERRGMRTNPGVELDPDEDVVFGVWDPEQRTFTELQGQGGSQQDPRRRANAVRAFGRRTKDRDNALQLIFAPVVGVFESNVERDAIAYITAGPVGFAFVGIDGVTSSGNGATIRSMTDGVNGRGQALASDGDIHLANGDVYGDVRAGRGRELKQNGGSRVTGWIATLDYALSPFFPPLAQSDVPSGTSAVQLPGNNKDWPLPPTGAPGTAAAPRRFRLNGDLAGVRSIRVGGYVELYVFGNVDLRGTDVTLLGNPLAPARLKIFVIGAATTVDLGRNAVQYAHVYAPQSVVRIERTDGFYGRIVGRTLQLANNTNLYYDDVPQHVRDYHITLVK